MADWDANSPELLRNLLELGPRVAAAARAREPLSSEVLRAWQLDIMRGLVAPDGEPFGVFRGEPGLDDYEVELGPGGPPGAPSDQVAAELAAFDRMLQEQLGELDASLRPGRAAEDLTEDRLGAVLILCAWAHGEWVRIHPFPNGNGRTARILVNSIALRYGLPAFLQPRPRPGPAYERASARAMVGDWPAAIPLFQRLYEAALVP